MLDAITPWLVAGFLVLAATGCVYALIAAAAMRRFTGEDASEATAFPSVTILKPLHGAELGLHDKLASFCDQDYPGPVQILFGVQDANDPAVAVVDRLIAERPGADLRLLVSTRPAGPNPKVATLIGLQGRIRHDVVVLSDSDVSVERNYLARTVATLAQPGVGLVTCLYRGTPVPSLWARLASMAIDYDFLPNVLVGLALGLARPCFGSTIAMRRETLERIGGFDAFLEYLADDNAIGEAVRGIGMRVAIPRWIVEHACPERSFMELWSHELRWARTLRAVSPAGYAGMVITHPLPFALLGASLNGLGALGGGSIVAAIACRLVLQLQVDHTLHVSTSRWWLGPARDLLAFVVYVASFFVDVVSWRGQRYRVRADGTLVSVMEPKA
ncbi:MAG: glycosyltransferase [Betaproteobacteria bacterium]|nr:MAG: glycosyltransferase [Betaproteobacteria bacterium]